MRALVLCAGHGSRLGELTAAMPKPLLPVGNKPLLAHLLEHLSAHGVDEALINLHYRGQQIKDAIGNGVKFGVKVEYFEEKELLGGGGTVRALAPKLSLTGSFAVIYGDLLIKHDLKAMFACHQQNRALATILLHQRARSNSIVEMDQNGLITRFVERPADTEAQSTPTWVNSGVYIFNPQIVEYIPDKLPCDLPREVFPALVAAGARFFGHPLVGYRCAIDSPERYRQACEDYQAGLVGYL